MTSGNNSLLRLAVSLLLLCISVAPTVALADEAENNPPAWTITELMHGLAQVKNSQASFVERHARRMINIHPSLLPAFPGLHTHRQALAAGVKIHGATVHFVTPRLDHGPIIVQAAVPVLPTDTEDTLARRVLAQEHRIYPQALRWLAEDRVVFDDNDVVEIRGLNVSSGIEDSHLLVPKE